MSMSLNQELEYLNNDYPMVKSVKEVETKDKYFTKERLLEIARNKKTIIHVLLYLSLIASWWFSTVLALTITTTPSEKLMALITATVLQAGTMVLLIHKRYIMAFLLFSLSIFGTVSYQYNMVANILQDSEIHNMIETKTEVSDLVGRIDNNSSRLEEATNREISNLEATNISLDQQLVSLTQEKLNIDVSRGSWWVASEGKRIDGDIAKRNEDIATNNARLSVLNDRIANNIESSISEVKEVQQKLDQEVITEISLPNRGHLGISKRIASKMNYQISNVILVIQIISGFLLECVPMSLMLVLIKLKKEEEGVANEN